MDEFLKDFPFTLVYSPTIVENKLFKIRDSNDYIILHTAIIEDVDVFITGDKDFNNIAIDRPEINKHIRIFRKILLIFYESFMCESQLLAMSIFNT